jgi:hypothetical protein
MTGVARHSVAHVAAHPTLAAPATSARKLRNRRAAIIGCVGVPARYGGFETLAEQLAVAAEERGIASRLTIWCSTSGTDGPRPVDYRGARLRHLPLSANGASSIPMTAPRALRNCSAGMPLTACWLLACPVAGRWRRWPRSPARA